MSDTSRGAPAVLLLGLVLAFGPGSVDIAAFTRLGGVFAGVMTGNLALLGLAAARLSAALAVHTGLAFAGYVVGAAVGTRIIGVGDAGDSTVSDWPAPIVRALVIELVVIVAVSAGWELTDGRPSGSGQLALLTAAALAMGVQSAVTRLLPGTISTTYLTGTLTGIVAELVTSRHLGAAHRRGLAILFAAASGAAAGGALVGASAAWLPAVPLAACTTAVSVAIAARTVQRT